MDIFPADKGFITAKMEESRRAAAAILLTADPEAIVYSNEENPEESWRVKDIIGHLTAWEEEMLRSLRAYMERKYYKMEEDEESFNQRQVSRRRHFSMERLQADWEEARAAITSHLLALDEPKMEEEMVFPWGARGTPPHLLTDLVGHEQEHLADVRRALNRPPGD